MGRKEISVRLTQTETTQEKHHEIKHKRQRRRQDAPSERQG